MINQLKAELERRTGLPASVVDQVVTALSQILAEQYPQYWGMIGPMLGLPATPATPGTPSTPAPGTTPPSTGLGPIPVPPGLTGTPESPAAPGGGLPDLTALGNELQHFLGGAGQGANAPGTSTPPEGPGTGSQKQEG
jgi:hypothetical protein